MSNYLAQRLSQPTPLLAPGVYDALTAAMVEGLDAALERAEACLEPGADMLFIEAPESRADMERITARFAARAPHRQPLHSALDPLRPLLVHCPTANSHGEPACASPPPSEPRPQRCC